MEKATFEVQLSSHLHARSLCQILALYIVYLGSKLELPNSNLTDTDGFPDPCDYQSLLEFLELSRSLSQVPAARNIDLTMSVRKIGDPSLPNPMPMIEPSNI
jgi:hypothetical protein